VVEAVSALADSSLDTSDRFSSAGGDIIEPMVVVHTVDDDAAVADVARDAAPPNPAEDDDMDVEVVVPEDYMGDIISDINAKHGKVQGMDPLDGKQRIRAQVPLAHMFTYSIDLRSLTQARGRFSMEFSHYDEVPAQLVDKIIAEATAEQE